MDLTDANIVVSHGAGGVVHPDGIIDFGDLTDSWAVGELAITLSSVLQHPGSDPTSVLPGIRAFHAIRPLSVAEAEALWPLLVLRTAVLIVSGAQQAAIDPDNAYVTEQSDGEWRMFEEATSVPFEVMTALIRADLGLGRPPAAVGVSTPMLAGVTAESVTTLDLSTTSDTLDCTFVTGGWVRTGVEDELARAAIDAGARAVVTSFGRPRPLRAPALSQHEPAVVPTGISLWAAESVSLAAPFDGVVVNRSADSVTLRGDEHELTLTGITAVDDDTVLGVAEPGRRVEVALRPVGAPTAPPLTTPALAPGWLALSRDPRPLLGLPALQEQPADSELIARRDRTFAPVQEHYYREPPRIERGWRHYLISTSGRCYLDMVNNVTVLGHAHPRVAAAAERQWRKLNTNSRFN